ncbi:hypothetical protein ACW9FF_21535 [Ralstonia mannitolilytica]
MTVRYECEDGVSHAIVEATQQQADPTTGEEIHVNVSGGDVYTLPLQASGMDKPRFVVHLPRQQQAEPVGDERIKRDAARFADAFAEGWVPLLPEDTNRTVELLRALAAQSGQRAGVPEEWREIVKELAVDLENELKDRYRAYPENDRRRLRDMAVIDRAVALLNADTLAAAQSGQRAGERECRHCGWMCRPNDAPTKTWHPLEQDGQRAGVAEGACSYCNGKGWRDEGDPEIGQAIMDCHFCFGTGSATVRKHEKAIRAHFEHGDAGLAAAPTQQQERSE